MRPLLIGLVIAVGFAQVPGQAQTPAVPKVQLTFEAGGIVSLVANGATVREILAEWTRKGGTPFVGAEKLTGSPVTLQFDRRPETEVVASLLRNAGGYVMGPSHQNSAGTSGLEVVFVLATSTPTGSYSAPASYAPQPQVSTPGFPDEIQPVGPGRGGQAPQPDAPPPPAPRPSGASGVAVPLIPVPSAPPPPTTGPGRGGGGRSGR